MSWWHVDISALHRAVVAAHFLGASRGTPICSGLEFCSIFLEARPFMGNILS